MPSSRPRDSGGPRRVHPRFPERGADATYILVQNFFEELRQVVPDN